MIDFKTPIEIFRINADATFELGKGVDPLVALGELSKAFMKQQDRIKRLEEAGNNMAEWLAHSRNFGSDPFLSETWNKAKQSKP